MTVALAPVGSLSYLITDIRLLIPVMATDHIRYDLLAQEALRGVVRTVLTDVAKKGLPGEHHFKITFSTTAPGVQLSERMSERYPQEMTIVLQYQFWDLTVTEESFEVGLSFGGVPERIVIPFDAITAFFDPSAQFGFQFELLDIAGNETPTKSGEKVASPAAAPEAANAKPGELPSPAPVTPLTPPSPAADAAEGGGQVVRLDRFRKK
jgi:uncharacterized protein